MKIKEAATAATATIGNGIQKRNIIQYQEHHKQKHIKKKKKRRTCKVKQKKNITNFKCDYYYYY